MSGATEQRRLLLKQLDEIVANLLDTYQTIPDPEFMVYELWTAKDILSHLTFWHESFARNVSDLTRDVKPTPLKGSLHSLNQAGVDEMRPASLATIIERFETAHKLVQENILNPRLHLIPYRKGSRDYSPEEHLEIVRDHIARHLRDVVNAANRESAHRSSERIIRERD